MTRTVFFTGGAGLIALQTIPSLLEHGYKVRVFDNMSRGDRARLSQLASGGGVDLIEQDVRSGGAVYGAMRGCTHAIHFAASARDRGVADAYDSIDVNLVGSHNVIAAAAEHGVQRLVFGSAGSVAATVLTPFDIAKRAAEELLGYYERQHGLSWVALRFGEVQQDAGSAVIAALESPKDNLAISL